MEKENMNKDKIVFFPTNNIGKYNRYKESFEKIGVDYRRYYTIADGKDLKVDVIEDGKTLIENAHKKAQQYYNTYRIYIPKTPFAIITTDEALYFEAFDKDDPKQPGLFVRRFDGMDSKRATDTEVVDRYTNFVKQIGGEAKARWVYSLTMYDGKKISDYTWEEPVLFSDTPHYPITPGYVLNNITIVGRNNEGKNVMLSDLSEEERFEYLKKYTDTVASFVNDNMTV